MLYSSSSVGLELFFVFKIRRKMGTVVGRLLYITNDDNSNVRIMGEHSSAKILRYLIDNISDKSKTKK